MPVNQILQNTSFNFKLTNENKEKGYNWCPILKMSFQSKDSIGTFNEIKNMIKLLQYKIKITIKLKDNKIYIIDND